MTLGKKISFGLLVVIALGSGDRVPGNAMHMLGIGAAHASEPGDKNANPDGAEMTDAWLFLGRRSGDRWRPASLSISNPSYPVKRGHRVVVKQDALIYGAVDCKVIDAADFKADGAPRPALLVKADQKGLEIVGTPIECPSVGRAKTVWANVKIPAARLVSVEK